MSLRLPCPAVKPRAQHAYIDKVAAWLKLSARAAEIVALANTCGKGGVNVETRPARFNSSFQQRLQLRQPKHEALEWLATRDDHFINQVEIALDIVFDCPADAQDARAYLARHLVRRWRGLGANFDSRTLAITTTFTDSQNALTAADITFNTAFGWALYEGPLRPGFYDFQRVAVHELGHAGGLNHSADLNSIMYPLTGDVEQPSQIDQNALRAQYAGPPPPLPPGQFACSPSIPWSDTLPLGDLFGTKYVLGQCLDKQRPATDYTFKLAKAANITVTIAADLNEMNAFLRYGLAEYPWRDQNTGNKVKTSPILKLAAGDYTLRVFPATAGSTFTIEFEFR